MTTSQFFGLDCVELKNETLSLLVTRSVGPRIVQLKLAGGGNLMAEIPDIVLEASKDNVFHIWGGHRLWEAPEIKQRTYRPDNKPVSIQPIENGYHVIVTQPTDNRTGIQRVLEISLPDQDAVVVVDHTVTNHSLWPVELAPWAITALKPGGVAILPQPVGNADADGLQPNRQWALWPYTDIASPHIHWGNQFVFVTSALENGETLKIGYPNPSGWLAYYLDRTLFVKQASFQAQAVYPDYGSSSECYCCARFIELETLGPLTRLAPGESVTHRETWRLFSPVEFSPSEANAAELCKNFGFA